MATQSPDDALLPRWPVLLGLVLAGVLLGVASAWIALRQTSNFGQAAGPWRVSLLAGSSQADAYTRARVALGGLLALNRAETMYYVATHDGQGQPLRSRCHWRIVGKPPPGRWWSLTAYAEDHFLFSDEQARYSINGESARLDGQGRFVVVTGPQAPASATAGDAAVWLPTPGDRGLVLTLRVYNPARALAVAPEDLEAPAIEALGDCR
jgi:hypothetical protein